MVKCLGNGLECSWISAINRMPSNEWKKKRIVNSIIITLWQKTWCFASIKKVMMAQLNLLVVNRAFEIPGRLPPEVVCSLTLDGACRIQLTTSWILCLSHSSTRNFGSLSETKL